MLLQEKKQIIWEKKQPNLKTSLLELSKGQEKKILFLYKK